MSEALPPPQLLAAARALVGLTQRQLAEAAGVNTSLIGRYEAGLTNLRSDNFNRILTALRGYGIRFIAETDDVAMGVLLLKPPSSPRKSTETKNPA
jgi:predicted transcriptional regulator